ncbi:MAG: phage scaffolding protein [Lactobacillus sp.]|nr:phage scaffolding protein [Lactococcus sp.]MDN6589854.1 phage scaffolding protein [Lactobacillus sp.]MDN6663150.1 phage scaffolding protein [Tetragenococcus koreensis]
MKREELKELGLTDDQINSVMASHGNTVNELNSQVNTLTQQANEYKSQLDKNQSELDKFKEGAEGNDELKQQVTDLQSQLDQNKSDSEQQIAGIKKDSAIDLALTQAGAKNIKAAKALLDGDKLDLSDDGVKGLDDQLKALKENESYLFEQAESTPNGNDKKATFNGNPSSGQGSSNEDTFAKALGIVKQ